MATLYNLFVLVILLHKLELSISNELDKTLLEAIIPGIGSKCEQMAPPNSPGQSTTFTFEHTPSPSYWHQFAAPMEPKLFQAEMSHINEDNANKSWTIRVGTGGNIYSFRGIYGEAMPPQYHPNGEYIDEVTQSVAVNLARNQQKTYFMHQAGTYYKDTAFTNRENAFFSPSIAKHCDGNQCLFGGWGQQAHLPTKFKGNILYFNGYRDCGNGVMELTSVFHNSGDDDTYIDYLNVPWGGVRYSVLSDIFESKIESGETKLDLQFPIKRWGTDNSNTITKHKDSGGFTVLAERSVIPDEVWNAQPFERPSGFTSRILQDNGAKYDKNKSNTYNEYCISVPVAANRNEPKFHGGKPYLKLVHPDGVKIPVSILNHWNWNGLMYICIVGYDVNQFNAVYKKDDPINFEYEDNTGGKLEDDMYAWTAVHGTSNKYGKRYRFGSGGIKTRDYNVYTSNTQTRIEFGQTYVNQQYVITGEFNQMISLGEQWKDEIFDDIIDPTEYDPKEIYLYSIDNKSFGTSIQGQDSCAKGTRICTGYSAPQLDHRPLFFMTCGDLKYVGVDKYYFSPERATTEDPIRSYVCNNDVEMGGIRPTWKLLGFFKPGECDDLISAEYDETLCTQPIPDEELWALGESTIAQIDGSEITIAFDIGPAADSIQNVYFYDSSCSGQQLDDTAVFTRDPVNDVVTGTAYSYKLELHEDRIIDSPLVTFNADRTSGAIVICSVKERVKPESRNNDGIVIVQQKERFTFNMNIVPVNFSITANVQSVEINGVETNILEDELTVEPCFCSEDSFDCASSNDLVVQQNGFFNLCITPGSEVAELFNLQVVLSAPETSQSYFPIKFGSNGYEKDDLTIITTGYQTGKTHLTTKAKIRMIYMFFEAGAKEVSVSGTAALNLRDSRETSRDSSFSTFRLSLTLLNEEVEKVESSIFLTEMLAFMSNFVTTLLPCLL